MDTTIRLRPRTGADVFRHVTLNGSAKGESAALRDGVRQAAAATPEWSAALAANPQVSIDDLWQVSTQHPNVWNLTHAALHPDSGCRLDEIQDALLAGIPGTHRSERQTVWAAAAWRHRDRLSQTVRQLLDSGDELDDDLADTIASVAAQNVATGDGDQLDVALLRRLLPRLRSHSSLHLAAAYSGDLTLDELVAAVERRHADMAFPARNTDVAILLLRRRDVLGELDARRERYDSISRSALEIQAATYSGEHNPSRIEQAIVWAENATSYHALQLMREAEHTPTVTTEQLERIIGRHQGAWQEELREVPRISTARRHTHAGATTAATAEDLFAWERTAYDRRIDVCEALLGNPSSLGPMRLRCELMVSSHWRADSHRVTAMLRRHHLPEGLLGGRLARGGVARPADRRAATAPKRLQVRHVLASVRGYSPGCAKHKDACTRFAKLMLERHGADTHAWQAAISLLDTLPGEMPVTDLVSLVGAV